MMDFNPARDTEQSVLTDFPRQSVDALLYYLFDVDLDDDQKELVKTTLLGKTRPSSNHKKNNADIVTSDFCEKYAQFRALGLSQRDTASMLGITPHRLESLLYGIDLSDKQYEMLLHAESTGDASLKHKCLQTLDSAIGDGQWKAAIALLEKRFPKEYGRKLEVNSNANVRWSADECEQAANKAASDLERIRTERAEANGVPQEELYVAADSTSS